MLHEKTTPKKIYNRERYNLNYSNLLYLLLTDRPTTARHSENSIHIFNRKQKLQLTKLKSAILQLNTRYYCNCYTENANKINYMEFV